MEQHPVPQNITSFEFRLIGDMTIKQFSFLAGGAIFAFIFWQLPLPSFIRLFFSFIFALGGFSFAFLPLEDRPLHRWFLAFIKAIYSPTQYVYTKSETPPFYLSEDFLALIKRVGPSLRVEESRQKLEAYLKTLPQNLPTALDKQEADSLRRVQGLLKTAASFPSDKHFAPRTRLPSLEPTRPLKILLKKKISAFAPQPSEGKPQPLSRRKLTFTEGGRLLFEEEKKVIPTVPFEPEKVAGRSEILIEQIKRLKEELSNLQKNRPPQEAAPEILIDYEKELVKLQRQLEEAEAERERLTEALLKVQKAQEGRPKGIKPQEILGEPGKKTVKILSPGAAKKAGLPKLTDIPNVITGIVEDKKGGLLPNILVEIKDDKNNSVRAFKTNKLGQFAAATPLEEGTYFIEPEDPREQFVFDIIEIKVDGSVLPPLAISAKDQAELEREKIRNSLFGGG